LGYNIGVKTAHINKYGRTEDFGRALPKNPHWIYGTTSQNMVTSSSITQDYHHKLISPRRTKKSMDGPRGGSYGAELSYNPRSAKRARAAAPKRKRRVTAARSKIAKRFTHPSHGWSPASVSTQIINPRSAHFLRTQKRIVNSTFGTGGIFIGAGPGTAFPVLFNTSTISCPQYATYTTLFNKMKVNNIKLTFELQTLDQTDDSLLPIIYIRFNHDPDLTTAGFTQTYFMQLNDVVKKTLTPGDNNLEYTFQPQVMVGGLQTPAGTYAPMPRPCGWVDSTQDVDLYGVQAYLPPFATGQQVLFTSEWDITWSEPK